MLASGDALSAMPNPLQSLAGSFDQMVRADSPLASSGPWGNTVASPQGNVPTGEAESQSIGAMGNSTPQAAASPSGPLAAFGGGNQYSQLLAQQAGQLPQLQQQQQSNRAQLLQALTNLSQQQANFKPPSQINQPLGAMAKGMLSSPNPTIALGNMIGDYNNASAIQAAQERELNNQNINNQAAIAKLPLSWSDEDIKNAQGDLKDAASFEKANNPLMNEGKIAEINQKRVAAGMPPLPDPSSLVGATPVANNIVKDDSGTLYNTGGQRVTPAGNIWTPAMSKDADKQVDDMVKSKDAANAITSENAANKILELAQKYPNLSKSMLNASGVNNWLIGDPNATNPLLNMVAGNGKSIMTPQDYADWVAASSAMQANSFSAGKNIRNIYEAQKFFGQSNPDNGNAASATDIANSVIAKSRLTQVENDFMSDYKARYQTMDGANEAFKQYVKENPLINVGKDGQFTSLNNSNIDPAVYNKYIENAPQILHQIKTPQGTAPQGAAPQNNTPIFSPDAIMQEKARRAALAQGAQ